jgi:hypothetical protein
MHLQFVETESTYQAAIVEKKRLGPVLAYIADRGDVASAIAGQGPRGAGERDTAGPPGEGDAAARHRLGGGRQCVLGIADLNIGFDAEEKMIDSLSVRFQTRSLARRQPL